jgi:hypothetical protein
MESSEKDGLQVSFDEESSTFTFEWDEETHPEYNYLKAMTPEEFTQALTDQLQQFIDDEKSKQLQSGGSSSGTPEVYDHPQPAE